MSDVWFHNFHNRETCTTIKIINVSVIYLLQEFPSCLCVCVYYKDKVKCIENELGEEGDGEFLFGGYRVAGM